MYYLIIFAVIVLLFIVFAPRRAPSSGFLQLGEYDYPYGVKSFDDLILSINTANPFL